MNCGVDRRHGSDLALLWLWCRLAATALIQPLAWEPPNAMGVALKRPKTKKKFTSCSLKVEINKDEIRCICSILFPRSPIDKHTISLTFLVVWEKEVTNVISPLLQMRKPRSEKRKWKTKSTVVWVTEQEKRNWVLETVIISRAYEYPWIIKSKVKPNC